MQPNLREAVRRIGEARQTRAESLDLSDLDLSELPAKKAWGDLPYLNRLFLGTVGLSKTGALSCHDDRESPLADLSPLAGLQALRSLNLSACTSITDLAPLAGLQALQSLNLSDCTGVMDLQPLARLHSLQSLVLGATSVADLSPLTELQALQCLELWFTGVTDLQPLARLQALQSLNLSGTDVEDLEPLAGLPSLQSLDLSHCRVAVPARLIRIFADHPHLTELVVDEAVGVPWEVLSHDEDDNCLPRLRAYLAGLDLTNDRIRVRPLP